MQLLKKYLYHPAKNFLAKYYLLFLRKFFNLTVIGITGSAGKTTVKEMLASILSLKGSTVWSRANIDPVFNISSTILRCTPKTKYLVLEMGVEHIDEMDFYLSLVKPDIGIITNIFPAHILYFKNIEGVLKEKSKLVKNTKIAVLNKGDKRLLALGKSLKSKVYWFEANSNSLIQNANTARSVAQVLEVSKDKIDQGLVNYSKPPHRLNLITHRSGAYILDDSYNSNPEAFLSTMEYFLKIAKNNKKIAVVGDMLELGDIEISEHKRIGNELKKHGFIKILGVGKLSKYMTSGNCSTWDEAYEKLLPLLKPNTYVLIKGSHSIGLDRLVDELSQ